MTAIVKCTGVAACVGDGGVFDWIPCVCVCVVFMVAGGTVSLPSSVYQQSCRGCINAHPIDLALYSEQACFVSRWHPILAQTQLVQASLDDASFVLVSPYVCGR